MIAALGQEERAAGRDRVDEEQLQLLAEAPVVAPLRFFEAVQVLGQLFFGREHDAVDALQHRALLVAAPVRAGDVESA